MKYCNVKNSIRDGTNKTKISLTCKYIGIYIILYISIKKKQKKNNN